MSSWLEAGVFHQLIPFRVSYSGAYRMVCLGVEIDDHRDVDHQGTALDQHLECLLQS